MKPITLTKDPGLSIFINSSKLGCLRFRSGSLVVTPSRATPKRLSCCLKVLMIFLNSVKYHYVITTRTGDSPFLANLVCQSFDNCEALTFRANPAHYEPNSIHKTLLAVVPLLLFHFSPFFCNLSIAALRRDKDASVAGSSLPWLFKLKSPVLTWTLRFKVSTKRILPSCSPVSINRFSSTLAASTVEGK
jgi:hypothetical protein